MDDENNLDASEPAGDTVTGVGGEAASTERLRPNAFEETGDSGQGPADPARMDEPPEAWVDFDPFAEDRYWAETYNARPYAYDLDYQAFQPACRYGWESFLRNPGRSFDEVEPQLKAGWDAYRGDSGLDWGRAREATRAAWNRLGRSARNRNTG